MGSVDTGLWRQNESKLQYIHMLTCVLFWFFFCPFILLSISVVHRQNGKIFDNVDDLHCKFSLSYFFQPKVFLETDGCSHFLANHCRAKRTDLVHKGSKKHWSVFYFFVRYKLTHESVSCNRLVSGPLKYWTLSLLSRNLHGQLIKNLSLYADSYYIVNSVIYNHDALHCHS